jgi:hemoglobin
MQDIQTKEQLQHLITVFYQQLMVDPIIGFFFTDIVQLNLETHIPKITDFWAFQLLGEKNYRGHVFEVHRQMHLKASMNNDHFHRWLFLLNSTIDALHAGPIADAMKLRATMIAKKMAEALAKGSHEMEPIEGVQIYFNTR